MVDTRKPFRVLAQIRGPSLFGQEGRKSHLSTVEGDDLLLEREPTNTIDPSAVIVKTIMGKSIGYVAREFAGEVSARLAAGDLLLARIAVPWAPKPGNPRRFTLARALIWSDGTKSTEETRRYASPPRGRGRRDLPGRRILVPSGE